jgi:hypothetical protein
LKISELSQVCPKIELDETKAKKPNFAEDFMLEHSHVGRCIALIGISASYGATAKELQHSTQSYGFPS